VLYEIAGHQCYQAHGNFIPQSLGIVGYGIRRFASALAANLSAAGKPLKYAFFGHWHSENAAEFAGITAFICPSLIGTQEYGFLGSGGGQPGRPAADTCSTGSWGTCRRDALRRRGPSGPAWRVSSGAR
jgi:hypothetical protein